MPRVLWVFCHVDVATLRPFSKFLYRSVCFYVLFAICLIEDTCFYVFLAIRLIEYTCFYVFFAIRLKSAGQMALRRPLHAHLERFWDMPAKIALRSLLEAHFEHFWGLPAKLLSGGLCRLILSISGACWPNGSQEASGASL